MRLAISDMKLPANEDTQTRGEAPFYVDEKAVNDYYPFGMLIADDGSDNRSWQSTDFRYGYNGQEKSLEIDPNGNHNTAEFWEYDARTARRWNLDPVVKLWESGYSTFGNNPIFFSDPNGDDLKTDDEGYMYKQEGLTATLGSNNPFGYDAKNGKMTVDDNFDISGYNKTQIEIFESLSTIIKDSRVHTFQVVDECDMINTSNNGGFTPTSLKEKGGYGITIRRDLTNDGNFKSIDVYAARTPTIDKYTGTVDADSEERGITSLHEDYHNSLFIKFPKLKVADNEKLTTEYENRVRNIFNTKTNFLNDFMYYMNPLNWGSKFPKTKIYGGEALPHASETKNK